jgi:hypothetical protein
MIGPQRQVSRVSRGLFTLALVALAGCGSSDEGHVPVEGMVFLSDRPLTFGIVILRPDASKGNLSKHEPRGKIDAEGKFQIFTGPEPGAAPGWYNVGVVANDESEAIKTYARPCSLIDRMYNNPNRSGLTLEVTRDAAAGTYDLRLPMRGRHLH